MSDQNIVSMLEQAAILLELNGENPFKVRAYQNAAKSLSEFRGDLRLLSKEGKLIEIKGVGKGIASDIKEYFDSGKVEHLEALKKLYPSPLLELLQVPGLGPKKVKKLHDELQIGSLGQLEYACKENRLLNLEGFGKKSQEKIVQGISYLKKNAGSFLHFEACDIADDIVKTMEKWKDVENISLAGSMRRKKEVVHDVDIVCTSSSTASSTIMDKFSSLPSVEEVLAKGETKTSVRIKNIQVDLRLVKPSEYPFALQYFTGSKEHNTQLRSYAKKLGFTLNEYGLYRGEKSLACSTEEDLYEALGMQFIPPELREGKNEIELALEKKLPVLIEKEDIQGFFHVHTLYSDGKNTIEEMVKKAVDDGYRYIGISDHSQTAFYARGLKSEDIDRQHKELDGVQKKYPKIRIFRGIESDILPDGELDYPDKILKNFDFVIASVHAKMNMSEDEMTKRCVNVLANPYCTMLGHPTGRLLLAREGFSIDLMAIMDAAKKNKKIIELNANPHRLDIDWRYLGEIKAKGLTVSINPDAHEVGGIDDIDFGVSMARKGGLSKKHVFNAKNTEEVEAYFASAK